MTYLDKTLFCSSLSSCIGSIYIGFIFPLGILGVLLGLMISLPSMFLGSLLVGQFLADFLDKRFSKFKLLIFTTSGVLLGIMSYFLFGILLNILFGNGSQQFFKYLTLSNLFNDVRLISVFVVYLGLGGLLTAINIKIANKRLHLTPDTPS